MTNHQRHDDADAFIREDGSSAESRDDLAEMLAEDFLTHATSGESSEADAHDEVVSEEMGGPFLVTEARTEFGATLDQDEEAEPDEGEEIEKENFPQANAPLIVKPRRK